MKKLYAYLIVCLLLLSVAVKPVFADTAIKTGVTTVEGEYDEDEYDYTLSYTAEEAGIYKLTFDQNVKVLSITKGNVTDEIPYTYINKELYVKMDLKGAYTIEVTSTKKKLNVNVALDQDVQGDLKVNLSNATKTLKYYEDGGCDVSFVYDVSFHEDDEIIYKGVRYTAKVVDDKLVFTNGKEALDAKALSIVSDQDNEWSIGKNKITVVYYGNTYDAEVDVIENDIQSIKFTGKKITAEYEDTDKGEEQGDLDDETYFEYDILKFSNGDKLKVVRSNSTKTYTYKNGLWKSGKDTLHKDSVYFEDTQLENHFTIGDNKVNVCFGGKKSEVTVTILPQTSINAVNATRKYMSYSRKKQTVKLDAFCKYGKVTYKSLTKNVTVSKNGVVTLPKQFSGKAVIVVSSSQNKTKTKTYKAQSKKVYVIVPSKAPMTLTKSSRHAIRVMWQTKPYSGYQIRYSRSKRFRRARYRRIAGRNVRTVALRKLKRHSRYYVQMRTYKTKDGKRYYSKWSRVKSIRTK